MNLQKEIHDYVLAHQDEIIATWKDIVDTPSKVNQRDDLNACCDKLIALFEGIDFEVEKHDVGPVNGPAFSGILGKDRPGKPVMFSGHYDTVPLAGDHPFRYDEEGHVRGLGSLDMKGGITIAYHICKMLNELGWAERPIKILFLGDEEKGHVDGTAVEVMQKLAPGALCDFNMETGLVSNAICVGRKGTIITNMTIHGIGAHSGNDFQSGRSAIAEAAHKIPMIEALTNLDKQTTVATTLIEGGTVMNSIPPICKLTVDSRIFRLDERERILAAMKEIAADTFIEGCSTEYTCEEYMPPFEPNEKNHILAGFVSDISEELGWGKMDTVTLGGGSDASHITIAGVPTICSIGVRGQFNHTEKEYALKESIFERTELLANAVVRIDEFAARLGE